MILKIALTGICVCILNTMLRQYGKGFIIFTDIIFVIIVLASVFDNISETFRRFSDILTVSNAVNKLYACLFKGALICILTKITCDISRENGNIVISDIIELSGRVMLLAISVPFIESVIKTALSFVK